MHPPIRTQDEPDQESISRETRLDPTRDQLPDTTRQEWKDDADVNRILARHGIGAGASRRVDFGTHTDYNADLQQAINATEQARAAFKKLPKELRMAFPSWKAVFNGIQAGKLKVDPETGVALVPPAPVPPAAPPAPPAEPPK